MIYSGQVGNAVINELRKKRMKRHDATSVMNKETGAMMPAGGKMQSGIMRMPISYGTKKGNRYIKVTPGKG